MLKETIADAIDEPLRGAASAIMKSAYVRLGVSPLRLPHVTMLCTAAVEILCAAWVARIDGGNMREVAWVIAAMGVFHGGSSAFLLTRITNDWNAGRYKAFCAKALEYRDSSFPFRIFGVATLLLQCVIAAGFLRLSADYDIAFLGLVFFLYNKTLEDYLKCSEPPRPDDGDAFYAIPSPA
jgi:hypothetical protein